MATQALKCERHGELTRLTCVDCGKPICPKCAVRTEVGLKCEEDATPAAIPEKALAMMRPSRTPLYLGIGGAALVVVLIIVVFVVKGGSGSGEKQAAQLPPVGTWRQAPDLASIRGTTTAVVLQDGKVLVAGGGVGAIPINAAELFDPVTGTWKPTGNLNQARRGQAGVLLQDGRVLVAGGRDADGQPMASAEIYNPATGTWSETAPMGLGRIGHTMTLLPDGRVLVTGGTALNQTAGASGGQTIQPDASAEIYDPKTSTWRPTAPMKTARFEHTATALPSGKVLIAGGQGPGDGGKIQALSSAELYDPAADAFVGTTSLSEPRTNAAAVLLSDKSSVLVVGGNGGPNADTSLGSAELYDSRSGAWTRVGPLNQPRTGETATLLSDGRVLVTGGESDNKGQHRSLASAEVYDPQSREWRSAGNMQCPRSEQAAVLLGDNTVLVVAGDASFPGQAPIAQGCADRYQP
jgi:N-acetylneuraminic acid mutarotase